MKLIKLILSFFQLIFIAQLSKQSLCNNYGVKMRHKKCILNDSWQFENKFLQGLKNEEFGVKLKIY